MTGRLLLAVALVGLAALAAGAVGAVVAMAALLAVLGFSARGRFADAAEADSEFPAEVLLPESTVRRVEQLSAQLSIAMADRRYFSRVVRPTLWRIATSLAARGRRAPLHEAALFGAATRGSKKLSPGDVAAIVGRMEQL
jgi:hypothetical protein